MLNYTSISSNMWDIHLVDSNLFRSSSTKMYRIVCAGWCIVSHRSLHRRTPLQHDWDFCAVHLFIFHNNRYCIDWWYCLPFTVMRDDSNWTDLRWNVHSSFTTAIRIERIGYFCVLTGSLFNGICNEQSNFGKFSVFYNFAVDSECDLLLYVVPSTLSWKVIIIIIGCINDSMHQTILHNSKQLFVVVACDPW